MSLYYSTSSPSHRATLEEAVMQGLAPDGGLFMPLKLPKFEPDFFTGKKSLKEIAFALSCRLFEEDIPDATLQAIVEKAFTFDAPLFEISPSIYALELFHGPTLSFKDFGARFMAGLMGFFSSRRSQELNILVATSGDTGSAVASAFFGVPGIKVWILYPSGKVSLSQEKQLTTMGGNIHALEIQGTFDDCQKLVKKAFSDDDLRKKKALTSANSINIARLLPQSIYYIYGYLQLPNHQKPVAISVPSGNFGNLMAGLLAKKMGLPIARFIAATNINDTVPRYFASGIWQPMASIPTLSNAMDVGNPSNFVRMLDLYDKDISRMKKDIVTDRFTDSETTSAVISVYNDTGYLLDPHGAVAYLGLKKYLVDYPEHQGFFLETAHPAKFATDIERMIEKKVTTPERLASVLTLQKQSKLLSNEYNDLKEELLS